MSNIVEIELTQGYYSKVDVEDLERVTMHSWCIQQYKNKSRCKKIYAKASIKGTQVTLHRFVMNAPKGTMIDHIDGDGLNNCKNNLRFTTKSKNGANRPKDRLPNATSMYKGVYWSKKQSKWCARLHFEGLGIHLGLFSSEIEAALMYNEAAILAFGESACLNQF